MVHSNRTEGTEVPELFFGLVGAAGTSLDRVESALDKALASVGYVTERVRLSSLLQGIDRGRELLSSIRYEDERILRHQDAGDELRRITQRGEALAALAVDSICRSRRNGHSNGVAYVLNSLKHPEEVKMLRELYRSSFILVSAFSPEGDRRRSLTERIALSRSDPALKLHEPAASRIILRDEKEQELEWGQNVRDTFPQADLFANATDEQTLSLAIARFVQLQFGNTFRTPTKDEYAMYLAHAAALRSADLGRQVGAVICSPTGNVVAVGTNEVPRAGGGLCWEGDDPDYRDVKYAERAFGSTKPKRDPKVTQQEQLLRELLGRLLEEGFLSKRRIKSDRDVESLAATALSDPKLLRGSQLSATLEFGRSVHAEMAAIVDAATRGVRIGGCTLFTTTFPCHLCAKHIVAAGIGEVVYVDPFPKSRAEFLYPEQIELRAPAGATERQHVRFRPFVGVAPRQYMQLFTMLDRKDNSGRILEWEPKGARPRYATPSKLYRDQELSVSHNAVKFTRQLQYSRRDTGELILKKRGCKKR